MAGLSISVQIRDQGVLKRLSRMPDAMRKDAGKAIGLVLVRGTQRRFMSQQDPEGKPWARLNPAYASAKRGAGILRASGLLMRSITYKATSGEVRVGTNRIYARIHQLGGTIVPKNKKQLAFRIGGQWVFAKKVVIPARPFLGISDDDQRAIGDVVEALLSR